MADDTPPLHPDLRALAPLLGTWSGDGRGSYPTIDAFGYTETTTFGHGGKPFLVYAQRTWAADDGRPLHVETGYWRAVGPGRIELVIAHPTGQTEVAEGTVSSDGDRLVVETTSTHIGLTTTAKSVTGLHRRIEVGGDELTATLAMAAVGQPLTHHLATSLRRAPSP